MDRAFTYARNQLLGLQFEAFAYTSPTGTYFRWRGGWTGAVCRVLCALRLTHVALLIFTFHIEVYRSWPS